jgi:MFS family permease
MKWLDAIFPRRALLEGDRQLLHLFIGRMLGGMGFAITIPFLSLYLHTERQVPMSVVGGIFFFSAFTGAAAQLLGGDWTDRHGRKIVLVGAQIGRGAIFLGLAAAVLFRAPILWIGVLTCVNLGWAVGPAIGGFLATLSYWSLFVLSAALLLGSGLFLAIRVRESSPLHRDGAPAPGGPETLRLGELGAAFQDRMFLRYCLTTLLLFTVMGQLISTLSVYVVDWAGRSKTELGYLYSLNGLLVVLVQFPVARLLVPFRMTTALIVGSLLYAVGYAMMGLGGSFALLAAAMFVLTMGEIVSSPASMNLVARFSSEEFRGRYMGAFGLASAFGWSVGPLVGGTLLDLARGRALLLWSLIASITVLGAFGFWDLRRRMGASMDQNLEVAA